MKVRFSPRARRRARIVAQWWRAHRPGVLYLFDDELKEAREALAVTPKLGTIYHRTGPDLIYRVLLPKTEQHLYYSIDDEAEVVMVLTIWGARRGRGPKL